MSNPKWSSVADMAGLKRFCDDYLLGYNAVFIKKVGDVWMVDPSKDCRVWMWQETSARNEQEAMALAEIMWRME